jgi:hypothetical protein
MTLDGAGEGVAFEIPQAPLPMALPVRVKSLNENCPVFLVDRDNARWRPLGVLDGTAYATLDTDSRSWRVFIGHPFVAAHAALVMQLAQIAPDAWMLEVHNPTSMRVESTIRRSRGFELACWTDQEVELPPGTSLFFELAMASSDPNNRER